MLKIIRQPIQFYFAFPNAYFINNIIWEILTLIYSSNKLIYFSLLRDYTWVAGNELVDTLAKDATQIEDFFSTFILFPTFCLKSLLKLNSISKWQLQWNIEDAGRFTYTVFSIVETNFQISYRFLILFLTNHERLQLQLYKIEEKTSPQYFYDLLSTSLIMCDSTHWLLLTILQYMARCLSTIGWPLS